MKRAKLLETRPFLYKSVFTFFPAGSFFEVLEEKEMPLMGTGIKIRSIQWNIILDGFHTIKDFDINEVLRG